MRQNILEFVEINLTNGELNNFGLTGGFYYIHSMLEYGKGILATSGF